MSTSAASDAAARAELAWESLARHCLARAPGNQLIVKEGPTRGARLAALWPFGQVLHAAAALLPLGVTDERHVIGPLLEALARYRVGGGYGPFPGDRTRYYDDNAWIALDQLQLAASGDDASGLVAAADVFSFVASGEAPDGGVYWVEGNRSRNTCSTGPAAQVALRLFLATDDDDFLAFAERQLTFLDRVLRDERGLYRDNVDDTGSVEPTVWSYNQGTPIGALVLLARATGDDGPIERALATARATVDEFGSGDRWWSHPPVFNAVFFRNLLALMGVAPDDRLLRVLDQYLERVWTSARHPRHGLFVDGGLGSYDGRPTIDHAGLTQLYAFRSWPRERWPDIC